MRVRVEDGSVLRTRAAEWDALLAAQRYPDATRSAGWLAAWWSSFGAPRRPGSRPVLLLAEDRGGLVGAAPMMIERLPGGPTIARHLGRSSHWFDPAPLVAADRPDVIAALGEALAALPADLIVLEDLVRGSEAVRGLTRAMPGVIAREQGEWRNRYRCGDPPRLRSRRKEARRLARRARDAGIALEIGVMEGRERAVVHLDEITGLVARAWSGRGDESEITGPRGRAYLAGALSGLRSDQVTTSYVRADGRLVAFDMAVHAGPLAAIFRGNWDREGGVPGAGWMSMIALIDHLTAAGIAEIDFGKFPWPYKRLVSSAPRDELVTLILSRGARGALARRAWQARPGLLHARHRARALAGRLRGAASLAGPASPGSP